MLWSSNMFKRTVHPKIKNQSSVTHIIQLQLPHKYWEEFWGHGRRNQRFPSTRSDSTTAFEGYRSKWPTTCFPEWRYDTNLSTWFHKSDGDFINICVTGTIWQYELQETVVGHIMWQNKTELHEKFLLIANILFPACWVAQMAVIGWIAVQSI